PPDRHTFLCETRRDHATRLDRERRVPMLRCRICSRTTCSADLAAWRGRRVACADRLRLERYAERQNYRLHTPLDGEERTPPMHTVPYSHDRQHKEKRTSSNRALFSQPSREVP